MPVTKLIHESFERRFERGHNAVDDKCFDELGGSWRGGSAEITHLVMVEVESQLND